jgi:hypothetical protein
VQPETCNRAPASPHPQHEAHQEIHYEPVAHGQQLALLPAYPPATGFRRQDEPAYFALSRWEEIQFDLLVNTSRQFQDATLPVGD